MKNSRGLFWISVLMVLAVSACGSGGDPELIAAFPSESGDQPREITSERTDEVDSAYLAIRVNNLNRAENEVRRIASNYGGYLIDVQAWEDEDFQNRILVLKVARVNFDQAVRSLKEIGELESDNISRGSSRGKYGDDGQELLAAITVQLISEKTIFSGINFIGWKPFQTLSKAFGVFVTIFGFIIDVLIWVVVVLGPFALIGFGGRKLVKYYLEKRQVN